MAIVQTYNIQAQRFDLADTMTPTQIGTIKFDPNIISGGALTIVAYRNTTSKSSACGKLMFFYDQTEDEYYCNFMAIQSDVPLTFEINIKEDGVLQYVCLDSDSASEFAITVSGEVYGY